MSVADPPAPSEGRSKEALETVVIRFCGDSGDGMQLAGTQFTNVSAVFGNDVSTLPDFPAEIRAPIGTVAGVSGFQICFSSKDIYTPGDEVDTLVAMNPAALKSNLADLKRGGTLIVNEDAFETSNLKKAGYDHNPLEGDEALAGYRVHKVPMTRLTRDSVEGLGLSQSEADRSKNFFALGLVYWLYDRDSTPTEDWVQAKFAKKPKVAEANIRALKGGSNFGFSTEAFTVHYEVAPAKLAPGKYRKITGNEAVAMGLATAARLSNADVVFSGYPITPASDILHELSKFKHFGVTTFQAEDEIAAMASTCGAAFGGAMAVTATSGPGVCLKGEAMGLGVITELPMVIVDVQRGGPSTGLPTKTEQSDLLLAMYGRNGESPMPVIAPQTPGDCFWAIQEAMRVAVEFMTPVMLLSDGYIANGAEPWMVPKAGDIEPINVSYLTEPNVDDEFHPYLRDERLVRPWARAGTPGLEHRVGGLEKRDGIGNVEYSPENHQHMSDTRARKIANVADFIPEQQVDGPESGDLLVLSWGGTFGSCRTAVRQAQKDGKSVTHAHLRYLNPFPRNLESIIRSYRKVLIPELNLGQLSLIIRSTYLVDAISFNKIQGKPFKVVEILNKINDVLNS
ncbi:MAG: 2-oxoacid:acceptor oxidoreductase subunit alpha [Fuerstiella sp.]|nr:2-oxoacid:acceptor oxidoreductase subunit alpha [Fuerstiella sp.]MCP4856959.1 2-oxoacid:acceptor oxidoreductase subunit alpha [Fuerstiella sp.]